MHTDCAKSLFVLNDLQWTKDLRFYAKNQFVFPEFYGSWYKSCAKNLWENCINLKTKEDIFIYDHLIQNNIILNKKDYQSFEKHVQSVEEDFWNKFKVFKEWQNKVVEEYNKLGYIKSFLGFKRSGYLTKNQILNSNIQCTAFHCLLWSLIQINKEIHEKNLKTRIVGQIHDEAVIDLVPEDQEYIIDLVKDVMTNRIKQFDWLIVPLVVEMEITDIDGSWYSKHSF